MFKGKNCFITGATGTLGIEIAKKFAEKGCNLFLTSTNKNKLALLKKGLPTHVKVDFKEGDLNKIEDINKIIKSVRDSFKTIDIVVNCVGIFIVKSLSASTLKDYESSFNVNIRATFLFSKEFSKDMITKKWGRIINIGSSSAYAGFKNTSLYCASKHAILGLSRALFDELKEHNIRVICVSPGSIMSSMGKKVPNQDYSTFIDPKEVAEAIIHVSLFDDNMVIPELKLTRMRIQ